MYKRAFWWGALTAKKNNEAVTTSIPGAGWASITSCRSRERFQVYLEYRSPRLQLALSSFSSRARRCRFLISSPSGRLAVWPNERSLLWMSYTGMLWSCLATVEQNWSNHFPIDTALCTQWYFTARPKTRLQTGECEASKINPIPNLFSALALCKEHRTNVIERLNILNGSPSSRTPWRYSPGMSAGFTLVFDGVVKYLTPSR